jgi:hypothetical protein
MDGSFCNRLSIDREGKGNPQPFASERSPFGLATLAIDAKSSLGLNLANAFKTHDEFAIPSHKNCVIPGWYDYPTQDVLDSFLLSHDALRKMISAAASHLCLVANA